MKRLYKFSISTAHLSYEINSMFDDWQTVNVELSDDEVVKLLRARKKWFSSEEFKEKGGNTVTDEEYFMMKYVPDIHTKVRKAIDEQAPLIFGDKIIPELFNLDIFISDDLDKIYLDCFEDWDGFKDVPEDKEEEQIRFWMKKILSEENNNG